MDQETCQDNNNILQNDYFNYAKMPKGKQIIHSKVSQETSQNDLNNDNIQIKSNKKINNNNDQNQDESYNVDLIQYYNKETNLKTLNKQRRQSTKKTHKSFSLYEDSQSIFQNSELQNTNNLIQMNNQNIIDVCQRQKFKQNHRNYYNQNSNNQKKKKKKSIPIKKINMQDVYNMNNKFEDINSNSIKATESNFSKTTDRFPIHSLNLKEQQNNNNNIIFNSKNISNNNAYSLNRQKYYSDHKFWQSQSNYFHRNQSLSQSKYNWNNSKNEQCIQRLQKLFNTNEQMIQKMQEDRHQLKTNIFENTKKPKKIIYNNSPTNNLASNLIQQNIQNRGNKSIRNLQNKIISQKQILKGIENNRKQQIQKCQLQGSKIELLQNYKINSNINDIIEEQFFSKDSKLKDINNNNYNNTLNNNINQYQKLIGINSPNVQKNQRQQMLSLGNKYTQVKRCGNLRIHIRDSIQQQRQNFKNQQYVQQQQQHQHNNSLFVLQQQQQQHQQKYQEKNENQQFIKSQSCNNTPQKERQTPQQNSNNNNIYGCSNSYYINNMDIKNYI